MKRSEKIIRKQKEAEFRELCERIRLLGYNCDNCKYGSDCGHDAANCPKHLTACLAFVAATPEEETPLGGNSVTPLVDLYKTLVDKVRQCFVKLRF